MASGAVSRKATSSYSSTSARNLDNNLDALLEDLQTSLESKPQQHQTYKPQTTTTRIIETSRKSPLRSASPLRSISPSQARTTTVEKYVSTGPAGTASGIPGLEMLDKELQDVQPGQSKTVAYKQVSYHFDKQQEGRDLEPWIKTDKLTRNDASIVDDFCERTFEKSGSSLRSTQLSRDSPDFAKSSNKEIIYKADVSTKTIPAPQPTVTETRSTERDFKYTKETSYHTEPSPISPRKNIKTVRTDETEELTNVEYIPASTPIPPPGPNTKVTKTIKTYTYELPPTGCPVHSLPRDTEKTVTYHIDRQIEEAKNVREYIPPPSPSTSRIHREEKVFVERRLRQASPPPPVTTTSHHTRSEKYLQSSSGYGSPSLDYPDHGQSTVTKSERIIYQKEASPPPRPPPETRTTVRQYEEHYSSAGRPPKPAPYYPETSHHSSTTHVYKFDERSASPRPFPTSERSASPRQQPPKRIEDLMASFSESEQEVYEKREHKEIKKEVDFARNSPPVVKSKNVAGPPVYYPPGAGEFTKKEESMSVMSKGGGGWAKERAAWEYGASNRSEEKVKSKKTVVPACLPLCCALPCVIM